MFLLAKNCFTYNALWAGTLSCCKIHPFLHNSGRFLLTFTKFRHDFNVILLIYRLAAGYPLCHQNTLDIKENNEHGLELGTTHACFFGPGDDVDFHCIDCCLVSRSYVNTQISSQVIIEFNKSGSFSMHCKRSKHNPLQCSFCSSNSSFGTIFHKPFSCSILPLEFIEQIPCPN